MKAVLIDALTGAVLNMIVADPAVHPTPPATQMVSVADSLPIDQNWALSGVLTPPRRFAIVHGANVDQVVFISVLQIPPVLPDPGPGGSVVEDPSRVITPGFRYDPVNGFRPPIPISHP